MNTHFYSADTRGPTDFGWLKSYHSFSFGHFTDEARMGFGALRVLNDDHVAGGKGFNPHPHADMEIVSIPLSGALKHKDSAGNEAVIRTGDVQIMSAGSGITHSEMNASQTEAVDFLQIWVFPQAKGLQPRYDQKTPHWQDAVNTLTPIVTPEGEGDAVQIMQQCWFITGHASSGQTLDYSLHADNHGVYLFNLEGTLQVGQHALNRRDALGISDTPALSLHATVDARFLLIEVPLNDFIE